MAKLALKTIDEFMVYLRDVAKFEFESKNSFLDENLDGFMNKIKREVQGVSDMDYIEINTCQNGIVDFNSVEIIAVNIDFKTYWVKLILNLPTKEISIGAVEL